MPLYRLHLAGGRSASGRGRAVHATSPKRIPGSIGELMGLREKAYAVRLPLWQGLITRSR